MLKIDDINILRMIFGIAFLRPLLNDVNADIDQAIIICNGAGYTIKKRFTTVFGYYDRMRAIKIRKDTLMSNEGLLLEDCYEYKPSDDEF